MWFFKWVSERLQKCTLKNSQREGTKAFSYGQNDKWQRFSKVVPVNKCDQWTLQRARKRVFSFNIMKNYKIPQKDTENSPKVERGKYTKKEPDSFSC